ncbi:MAG: MBL fold metallo-hydrolase [Bdellovibrionaceae bacterium]|nr:MBL fold metallo-hydrolase [Pseudobdellovibrionaceae bacterium]NUM57608.1 MBL fold metallo-hydrolase [Pseudobdellovibrionaceae bacterium]
MKEQIWQYKETKIQGVSLAGTYSAYLLPDQLCCIDVGQGFDWLLNVHQYFITHGHMDHAAGIAYIISQKNMRHHPKPQFYMPASLIGPMTQIVRLWSQIEKFTYDFEFFALEDFKEISLKPGFKMRPFKTKHRIDSFGFSLIKTHKSLAPEFQNKNSQALAELKKKGIPIEIEKEKILISFSGDTEIEFLDMNPHLYESEILFLESTFIDDKKTIEQAKTWGHIHFDEIISRLPYIKAEKVLLKHLSGRYSLNRAEKILDEKLPPAWRQRFEVFPGR